MQTLRRGTIKLALTQTAAIATETTAEGAAAAASADPLVLVCVRMHVWCVSAEVMQML